MNQKLYLKAKAFRNRILDYKFDLYHKKSAKNDLKSIELVKGKTDPKLFKLCDEYSIDVFGWKGYAPWLYVYSAFSETFKEGWIPDNYYGKIVVPKIQGDYGKISFLKPLTKKIFKSDVFPDAGYYVNGIFYTPNYTTIQEKSIQNYLFEKTKVVVFKLDNSMQGLGVFFFDKNSFNLKKIKTLGNGVFQEYINQHPFFSELMPTSVATLRMTTVIDNYGTITNRTCFLRIGRKIDTHINENSELVIPVDFKSGELAKEGYFNGWIVIDKHPDSNVLFANRRIPNFEKCVATVLELHKIMPYVRCIGWDLIVDKNEQVKIMEWNGSNNDIKFSEATQGPCFSDLGWENLWKQPKNS